MKLRDTIHDSESQRLAQRMAKLIGKVIATCAQQGRSAFEFILDSVHAHVGSGSPPSLLPSGP
jgi:hypothetical protein